MDSACFECDAPATEAHHVVPRSRGGTRTVPLCGNCHGRAHGFRADWRGNVGESTRVALRRKAANGEAVGRTPFGLLRDGAGFTRDPATWPTVARILRERAAGASCQRIADGLNADDVPTATATRPAARGLVTGPGKWHAATVAKLCRNAYVLAEALRAGVPF